MASEEDWGWTAEAWSDLACTFATKSIDLKLSDVKQIVAWHAAARRIRNSKETVDRENPELSVLVGEQANDSGRDFLGRVNDCMHALDGSEGAGRDVPSIFLEDGEAGYFVRLNTLSPKDAVLERIGELTALTGDELKRFYEHAESPPQPDAVRDILAVNGALYRANRVTSPEEAVGLLIQSERVHRHLVGRLEDHEARGGGGEEMVPPLSLCIRRWAQLQPELEFRSFVKNNEMVALSHYYQHVFVPELARDADAIRDAIQQFFVDHVRGKIPDLEDYVCDFCTRLEDGRYRVALIELNPLQENSSAAMFSWENDRDILIGKEFSKGMPFRFHEHPLQNAWEETLSIRLQFVVDAARESLGWPLHREKEDTDQVRETGDRRKKCLIQ